MATVTGEKRHLAITSTTYVSSGDVTVGGNLVIDGSSVTLNTQTVEVEDNILQLNTTQGSPDTATATTSGISVYRGDGVTEASFIFDDADDTWDLTNDLKVAGNLTVNSRLTFDYGGDHYFEAGTNSISYKASGGGTVMTLNASTLVADFSGDIIIPATKALYLDGGGGTYIYESSDGVIDFYGDTVRLFTIKQNGTQNEVVVNEASGDVDFRVEANNSTHAFFVEAEGDGAVGIGVDDPAAKVHIDGTGDLIRAVSKNTGSAGAQIDLLYFKQTNAPADDDIQGLINFGGYYSGTNSAYSSSIRSVWNDASEQHGQLEFWTRDGAEWAERLKIDHDGLSTFTGNVNIYSGASSAEFNIGRNNSERLSISQTDNHTTLTADNDSDSNGDHEFRLNRTFEGTGANNFVIQKDGTAQFTVDTNAVVHIKNRIDTTGAGVLLRKTTSAWTGVENQDILYQGWNSNTGDYIYLKAPGNSTTNHGTAFIGDNVIAFGHSDVESGVPELTSAAAPISDNWLVLNSTDATFKGDINTVNRLAITETTFGYSSSYKVVQYGETGATKAISLGYNPSGNANGGFSGNEILIPNNIRILAPNAADDQFYGVMMFDDDDKLLLGSSNYLIDTNYILKLDPSDKSATFVGDVTVDGGDFNLTKQNGSPAINMLYDGTNPGANTLLHYINYKVDYSGTHQDWGGIEHRTTGSATRTKLNFNVKSTGGNVLNALSLDGTTDGTTATFGGSVTADSFIKDGGTSSQFLMADGSVSTAGSISGSGTGSYIAKWTNGTTLGDSVIFENGNGEVGVGTSSVTHKLQVAGTLKTTGRVDIDASTSTSSSATGTTLLHLKNYVGSDLQQQKTFIDFTLTDDNGNETPQVRIGAEVGQDGNADSQVKEGSGAFVVYTNTATNTSGAASALNEHFRINHNGTLTATGNGTSNRLQIGGDVEVVGSTDFAVPAGRRIRFGGAGSDTHFREHSADRLILEVGGQEYLDVNEEGGNMIIGQWRDNDLTRIHGGAANITVGDGSDNAYVGINDTSPSYPLDVNGNTYITGTLEVSSNITAGATDKASDTVIKVLANDDNKAGFEAYGASQGTGYIFVGQSADYGGGISYNGDGSPAFATGETADGITFFRRDNGTNIEVFKYQYDSNTVTFNGSIIHSGTDFNLPSSGQIDWANGDARIVEGLVNNYSLSFQTYDGTNCSTALRLDGNNDAYFEGNIDDVGAIRATGNITISKNNPVLILDETTSTSDADQVAYISFQDNGSEEAWVGWGSSGNSQFTIKNNIGMVVLDGNGTTQVNDNLNVVGTITGDAYVSTNSSQSRAKFRLWDQSSNYAIGMKNGFDYGHIGSDEYAMTFQMNDSDNRGFWWGDTGHSDDQGAMSLTTNGKLVVATSLNVGEGEGITSPATDSKLHVNGMGYFNGPVVSDSDLSSGSDVLFAIVEADTTESIRRKLNNTGLSAITRVDDATAPAEGCFQITDTYYNVQTAQYFKVDDNCEYTFEVWVRFVSGADTDQRIYAGSSFFDSSKTYLGNSQRYWGESGEHVDANSRSDGNWYHVSGTLGPNRGSNTGEIPTSAEWMQLLLLLNYSSNANTVRYCGLKFYKSGGRQQRMVTSIHRKSLGSQFAGSHSSHLGKTVMDTSGNLYTPQRLYHYDDTDTYLEFPSENAMHFYTANGSRLEIDSNGNTKVTGKLGVGSLNTGFDFYNNGTSYLNGNVTIDASTTVTGNGNGFYFSEANQRIYFDNARAMEGGTGGSNLQIAEGFSQTTIQSYTVIQEARADGTALLHLDNDTNGAGAMISFTDNSANTQVGKFTYRHSDGQSQGGGASFHFTGTEADLAIICGDSTVNSRVVVSGANSTSEVSYGFYGDTDTGMYRPAANQLGLVAGSSRKVLINSNGVNIQNGALGVGASANATDGRIDASNDIVAYSSDKRLKENIKPLDNALDKIEQLTGFTYNWNDKAVEVAGFNKDESLVGVFAQDVEKVLPEAVKPAPFDADENGKSKSGEDYITVQYEKIVPLLIEAVKDLSGQVKDLKEQLKNK